MNNDRQFNRDSHEDVPSGQPLSAGSKPSGCGGECAGCACCGGSLYPPFNPFAAVKKDAATTTAILTAGKTAAAAGTTTSTEARPAGS